eukprot:5111984-Amphidinium_carterae.4
MACPTPLLHSDCNVQISIHVDDSLGVGPFVNVMGVFRTLQQHLEVRVAEAMGMEKTTCLGTLFWRDDDSFYEQATEGYIAQDC